MHYLRYWSLRYPPFASGAASFFFACGARRAALADIQSHVVGGHAFALLVGPSGCGITTLLKYLTDTCGFGDCACEVVCTQNCSEPIDSLAAALGIRTAQDLLTTLTSHHAVRIVWLIDGCGQRQAATAKELARQSASLSVVAAVTADTARRIHVAASDHRSIRLGAFSEQETGEFIARSLRAAGCYAPVFDQSAVSWIHRISGGRVRIIGELARHALALGAARRMRRIGRDEIDQLAQRDQAA